MLQSNMVFYKDIKILWQSILLNPKNLSKEITNTCPRILYTKVVTAIDI